MSEQTARDLADKILDSISIEITAFGIAYERKISFSGEARARIAKVIEAWDKERRTLIDEQADKPNVELTADDIEDLKYAVSAAYVGMGARGLMRKLAALPADSVKEEDIVSRLLAASNGHPFAKIAWPHRILHDAVKEIESLRTKFDAERERADAAYNHAEVFQRRLTAAQEGCVTLDAKCQLYEGRAERLNRELLEMASEECKAVRRAEKAEGEAKALREAGQALLDLMDEVEIDVDLGDETDRVFSRAEFAPLRAVLGEKSEVPGTEPGTLERGR